MQLRHQRRHRRGHHLPGREYRHQSIRDREQCDHPKHLLRHSKLVDLCRRSAAGQLHHRRRHSIPEQLAGKRHVGPDVRNERRAVLTQCSMLVSNPNLENPKSIQWNFDIQRAITNNLTLDVAYVGVHGFDEIHTVDLNEPALGSGWDARAIRSPLAAWGAVTAPIVPTQTSSTTCAADAVAEQNCEALQHPVSLLQIHCSNHEWIPLELRRIASDPGFPELPRPELPHRLYLQPRSRRLDQELAGDVGPGQPGQPAISVRKQRHGRSASACGSRQPTRFRG